MSMFCRKQVPHGQGFFKRELSHCQRERANLKPLALMFEIRRIASCQWQRVYSAERQAFDRRLAGFIPPLRIFSFTN